MFTYEAEHDSSLTANATMGSHTEFCSLPPLSMVMGSHTEFWGLPPLSMVMVLIMNTISQSQHRDFQCHETFQCSEINICKTYILIVCVLIHCKKPVFYIT